MYTDLQNKVVVLTGACGLLGKTFVKALIENNARVVATDIDEVKLKDLMEEIKHPNLSICVLSITVKESIQSALDFIYQKQGKIDVLINNAYPRNKNYGTDLESVQYADFCENNDMHLGGYFLTMQQFSLFFKQQGFGHIISMSSIYGLIPPRFEVYENAGFTMPVEYAAIKSGVIHLTKYFAKYYKGKNIRFNCISPGGILNNQDEHFLRKYNNLSLNKGMLDREDITGTLLFLVSEGSQYINGQNIIVDDGFTL